MIARLVSGGQTGADRAALDVAIELGIPYGGWCPADGWAEDLPDPPGLLARYPGLRPTASRDPDERTLLNVRDADATLLITAAVDSPGTDLTRTCAEALGRPLLEVMPDEVGRARSWLGGLGPEAVLNIAGQRESEAPGHQAACARFLRELLA